VPIEVLHWPRVGTAGSVECPNMLVICDLDIGALPTPFQCRGQKRSRSYTSIPLRAFVAYNRVKLTTLVHSE
jgi:hypothetical protein